MRKSFVWILSLALAFLSSCATNHVIVNDVDEREANEIIIFLASRGIAAEKVLYQSGAPGVGGGGPLMWSIAVDERKMTEAMALLNQNGLPRKKGTNLLELFAKQGLMSSEKEEMIRYQAGLEQQIANTIRKIDGVLDADVQLSFPSSTAQVATPGQVVPPQRVTASVYVKHQGVLDDANNHLVSKIKRLVAASVNGLDINDVTVISDRSRFADISLNQTLEAAGAPVKDYVSIWSIVLSKQSALRFRLLFFSLITANIVFLLCVGWLLWKFYPILRDSGGFKKLFHPLPFEKAVEPAPAEEVPIPEEVSDEKE